MRYSPRPYVPDVDTTPRPLPPSLLAVTCAEAFGWWIECRCTTGPDCHGGVTQYPVRLLIQRHHCGHRLLLDVAARLRCKGCRSKPSSLQLIDDVQRVPKPGMRLPGNAPVATVIDLLPYLAATA